MQTTPHILVVEDNDLYREFLVGSLRDMGCITEAGSADEARQIFLKQLDLVLMDVMLPQRKGGPVSDAGKSLLQEFIRRCPETPVLMISGQVNEVDLAVESMRLGAYNYHLKDALSRDKLRLDVTRALQQASCARENRILRQAQHRETLDDLLGVSATVQELKQLARKFARLDLPVLITGETGVGKELLARGMHAESDRRDGPFQTVNCPALPPSLLESELFGHAKGAYTGATTPTNGHFVAAQSGTLFLDEIGDLPLPLQVKILRAVENNEITPVGTTETRRIDVRIIAATNSKLADACDAGRFRLDLYHRLALQIDIPPLRERSADIPVLAREMLERQNRVQGRGYEGFSAEAIEHLLTQDWPGNVRELQNVVARGVALGSEPLIQRSDFIAGAVRRSARPQLALPLAPLPTAEGELRRCCAESYVDLRKCSADQAGVFVRTFIESAGNVVQTAGRLGIQRGTASNHLREYGPRVLQGLAACNGNVELLAECWDVSLPLLIRSLKKLTPKVLGGFRAQLASRPASGSREAVTISEEQFKAIGTRIAELTELLG